MKRKRLFLALGLLFLSTVGVFLFRRVSPRMATSDVRPETRREDDKQNAQSTPDDESTWGSSIASSTTELIAHAGGKDNSAAASNSITRAFARYSEDWKKPISFFGKVIDEQDRPLDGVRILFQWNDLSPSGTSRAEMRSDTNGLFSLTEATGRVLSVELSKAGYRVVRKGMQFNFEYARQSERDYHKPDPDNPVLFRLRQVGPGAELITSQHGVKRYLGVEAPLDGRPVAVDLMARSAGSVGQLIISQSKPDYAHWKEATAWAFRMEIPDGGFVEHSEEFPFFAPEAGYKPVIEFRFKKDEDGWSTMVKRQYYFVFGSPRRYGRLNLETWIEMGGARLEYAINPTGSPYLEPQEKQLNGGQLMVPGAVQVPLRKAE